MSGAAAAPAEGGAYPEAKAEKRKPDWLTRKIDGIAGFFKKAALGVLGAGVGVIGAAGHATLGNVPGEAAKIAELTGHRPKAKGTFARKGEVGEKLVDKPAKIAGGTVYWGLSLPGRVLNRVMTGSQMAYDATIGKLLSWGGKILGIGGGGKAAESGGGGDADHAHPA